MRTLKKALSLVLVLAMVLSLGVSAFAAEAKNFSDYASVQNKEAVDVMVAIDVISGRDNGTYDPTAKFTRAEAATMIARLTLGKTVAEALPATATKFNDVPATHWAAKYVQYCADAGIINGYGEGKFGPDDQLTSTQWALMLLGALGYNAKNENIGGTGWEIAVTRLAMNAKVASAEDLTGTFNRDVAAKMALNTLKADLVEYGTNGTSITIDNTTINTGASKAEPVVNTATESTQTIKKDKVMQFAEQHFPKLKLNAGDDAFGRTQNVWTLDGKDVGSYVTSNATLKYTGEVKATDIYKDLGRVKVAADKVTVDGNTADAAAEISGTSSAKFGGANCAVEVYYDSDAKEATIVVVKYEVAQVTKVTAEKTSKTGVVTPASVTLKALTGSVPASYETAAFEKDDILLVAVATVDGKAAVQEAILADSVEGTATATRGTNVTINGTSYTNNATVARGDKGTFYLGVDGSVVYAKATSTASDDYGYVYNVVNNDGSVNEDGLSTGAGKTIYMVTADGSKVSYKLAKDVSVDKNTMICYVINSDGLLELGTKADGVTASDAVETIDIGKGHAKMGSAYANADTKFVFIDIKEDKGTVNTSTTIGYTNVSNKTDAKVWKVVNKDNRVTTAFVLSAAPSETAENIAILLDAVYTEGTTSDNKAEYIYSVMVDGAETELTSKTKLSVTSSDVGKPFVYVESDGYVTSFEAKTLTNAEVTDAIDNYVVLKGVADPKYLTDDAEVYLVEIDEGVATVTTTTLQKGDTIGYYLGKGDNSDKIVAAFVTARAE